MLSPRVFWQDSWTGRGNNMTQTLVDLGQAETTSTFWKLYEANPIMNLPLKCSLHVFRQNVKPEWEDPSNLAGGHFRLSPSVRTADTSQLISSAQRLWFNILTKHVGENFSVPHAVVGCGFTNKGSRQIASLWINTTDEGVVKALEGDIAQIVGDKFQIKFVQHRQIVTGEGGKTQVQLCHQHRRTRSAPGKILTVDIESDDDSSQHSEQSPSKVSNSSLADRRGKGGMGGLSLDPGVGVTTPPAQETAAPVAAAAINPHHRSKSDGHRKDVVPVMVNSAGSITGGGRPLAHPSLAQATTGSSDYTWGTAHQESSDLRSSGSGLVLPPVAPSPMKEWASGWSPSLLEAAFRKEAQARQLEQLTTQGQPVAEGAEPGDGSSLPAPPPPPTAIAPSPNATVGGHQLPIQPGMVVAPGQPPGAHHPYPAMPQQVVLTTTTGGHIPAQAPATHVLPPGTTLLQQVPQGAAPPGHYQYGNPYAYGQMSAPPQFEAQAQPAPQQPAASPPKAAKPPAAEPAPAKSDASAFVFKGHLFPAGLNRKERRRICFSSDFDPKTYDDAIFVGNEQEDGPRTDEEEALLRKGIIPKSSNNSGGGPTHERTESGQKKWAGAGNTPPPTSIQPESSEQ